MRTSIHPSARIWALSAVLMGGALGSASASTTLWLSDDRGNIGTVHTGTGAVHKVGNAGVVMTDIAISPGGDLYGVSGTSQLFHINPFTAHSTFVGNLGQSVNSLTFSTSGVLYAAGQALFTINVGTGLAHLVGSAGDPYNSSGDLSFYQGQLFLSSAPTAAGEGDHLFRLDAASGAGTDLGATSVAGLYGLAADDTVLYGLAGNQVYTVNPLTHATQFLVAMHGDGLGPVWGAAVSPVPEPETWALLLGGLFAVTAHARRRSR